MQATTEGTNTVGQSVAGLQALQEDLKAQKAIAEKMKNVGTVAETKVDRLRAKLRQSSDRKASIRATIRKSINELKARLDDSGNEHTKVLADLEDQRKALARAEQTINE